jgi:hypothetical protein
MEPAVILPHQSTQNSHTNETWAIFYRTHGCICCRRSNAPYAGCGFCRRCRERVAKQFLEAKRLLELARN